MTEGEIHLWHENLEEREYLTEDCRDFLSSGERRRAEAFRFVHLQERHIVGKVKLRLILSRYLQVPPAELRFAAGQYGKPAIEWPQTDIDFNVSHSESDLVVAVTRNQAIGVDIEGLRPLDDLPALVKTCLADEERSYWSALPEKDKLSSFYHFWTAKEAWVKAVGCGIGIGLETCVLALDKNNAYKTLPQNHHRETPNWRYRSFHPRSDLIGAVAYRYPIESLTWHRLNVRNQG